MIRSASVCTFEIDDIALACIEIKTQINEKLELSKNTVGIVQCDPEFIEAGLIGPLYGELQFPLVGGTTVSSASNDCIGNLLFSMLVLTSDDVDFMVSHTNGLEGDCDGAIQDSLKAALTERLAPDLSQDPLKLILAFPPVVDAIAGDSYIDAIEKVCGSVPIFGTLNVDESLNEFDRSVAIFNGEVLRQEMSYCLLFGNVNPRLFVTTIPKQPHLNETRAVITKAKDNIAYEINHKPAIKYFENIGFASNGKIKEGVIFLPLLLKLPGLEDEIPFVRALINTREDGSVVFRSRVFEGATFTFGSYYGSDVLASTSETVSEIRQEEEVHAILLFSCIIRQLVVGADPLEELKLIRDLIGTEIPFLASYAGGEICPTSVDEGNQARNRFHNYSLVTCVL